VVGNTRADLDWKTFYEKELEVRYSRSYGPGRYDPTYEWAGVDYPIGYVRWTETRNFEACLHLLKTGALRVDAITTRRLPFGAALEVYRALASGTSNDLGVVLEYPVTSDSAAVDVHAAEPVSGPGPGLRISSSRLQRPIAELDVVGAGNFARTMLLPHLKGRIAFGTVANQTALSANHVKLKFGFTEAATDASRLVDGDGPERAVAAVLIATRHHLHAPLVTAALGAGRHVFVEKPLCLTRAELAEIDGALERGQGSVMVGFNRRFAPATVELRRLLASVTGARSMSYRVAAGRLDPHHWYANLQESGGRVLGEACHFLDYFCSFVDAPPVRVFAQPVGSTGGRLPFPDSVAAQVEFQDGSCGQLIYSADGDTACPKEKFTLFAPGLVAEIIDFQKLTVYQGRRCARHSFSSKGHAEEMAAWVSFLQAQTAHPLPYPSARQSMSLTFAVLESIQQARAVAVQHACLATPRPSQGGEAT
jgi:predicted dehydrogenase